MSRSQNSVSKNKADIVAQKACCLFAPPPILTISEWADRFRTLSSESAAEPGRWRTERTPYLKGIMDAAKEHEETVLMTSAQVGKTSVIENIIGYFSTSDPCPVMVVQPTLEIARTFSVDRLAPMVRDCPAVGAVFNPTASRDSANTIYHKSFAGGNVTMSGANSPASLASRPIRVLLLDEVDRFPVSAGTEGDPVDLARKRTTAFWNRRVLMASTPTISGVSRIEKAWKSSYQARFHVPCPHCQTMQPLWWKGISWDDDMNVHYTCQSCGTLIEEKYKPGMLVAGKWVQDAPENAGRPGFHLNELYSPFRRWGEVVSEFLRAKKSPETLKVWINTSLGECWVDNGASDEGIDHHGLLSLRENYDSTAIPADAVVLTAGVDVQGDRLEVQIVGFGPDYEAWVVDHQILWGDPDQQAVWSGLDQVLMASYSGRKIACACVDSGGHHTQRVYSFTRPRSGRRVFAIKGVAGAGKPVISGLKRVGSHKRQPLYLVGVHTIKDAIYARLTAKQGIHFPSGVDEEYFSQLTSEVVRKKFRSGQPYLEYELLPGRRNEALDTLAYSWAAAHILNPKFSACAIKGKTGEQEDVCQQRTEQEPTHHPVSVAKPIKNPAMRRPKKGGWSI